MKSAAAGSGRVSLEGQRAVQQGAEADFAGDPDVPDAKRRGKRAVAGPERTGCIRLAPERGLTMKRPPAERYLDSRVTIVLSRLAVPRSDGSKGVPGEIGRVAAVGRQE